MDHQHGQIFGLEISLVDAGLQGPDQWGLEWRILVVEYSR